MEQAITTLKGKAKVRRTMWSRQAQEYETKIKSGDPVSIAEVVRDLHRRENQSEQSYSERQMYQAALERGSVLQSKKLIRMWRRFGEDLMDAASLVITVPLANWMCLTGGMAAVSHWARCGIAPVN